VFCISQVFLQWESAQTCFPLFQQHVVFLCEFGQELELLQLELRRCQILILTVQKMLLPLLLAQVKEGFGYSGLVEET